MKRSTAGSRSYALFDIGASSIGAGLGVSTPTGVELLWYTRIDYAFVRGDDFARYEKSMYAALLEVGMLLTSEGVRIAKRHTLFSMHGLRVTCVLAPPWFFGTCIPRTLTKDKKPFEITHSIADEMHAAMFKELLELPECANWRTVMGEPELMEQYDVGAWLDGYPVQSYEKRTAHELTLRTYIAVVAQSVTEHVRDIVHRVLPNNTLALTSTTRLFTQAARGRVGETSQMSAVWIEVGGQVTSVSLLRDGIFMGTRTFPYGTNDLLLAIAPEATTVKEAQDAYYVYRKHHEGGQTPAPSSPEVETVGLQWHTTLRDELIKLSDGVVVPRQAFLHTPTLYDEYAAFLSRPMLVPGTRSEQSFEVTAYPLHVEEPGRSTLGTNTDTRLLSLMQTVDESLLHHY